MRVKKAFNVCTFSVRLCKNTVKKISTYSVMLLIKYILVIGAAD